MRAFEFITESGGGKYRLVRVVDGLDNIESSGDGTLTVMARHNGHSARNTLHFTANSVVGDHTMGKFPGKFVIIANPAEMPRDQLAGARAEDTWYRFDDTGELSIGNATILAPEGSSVPNGIKAQFYKGDRTDAIDNAFKQIGIKFQGQAEPFKVSGIDNTEYHKDYTSQHGTGSATGDSHSYTVDSDLESLPAQLEYRLKQLQKDFFYTNDNGADAYVTTAGKELIDRNRQKLDKLTTEHPEAIKSSASYFNYIKQTISAYEAIFNKAEKVYNQQDQEYEAAKKQWKVSQRPGPGQPPPLNPEPPPMSPEWPPKGLDLSVPDIKMAYTKKDKTVPNKMENFADGKNPGRKGLAKRSGVNTKASVSSLRKTAKHSTGEKARMAHWMANMKAGKAKKK